MKAQKLKRLRFNVPENDTDVIAWLNNQYNTSVSIRTLIKHAVRSYGMEDITCLPSYGLIFGQDQTKNGQILDTSEDTIPEIKTNDNPIVDQSVEQQEQEPIIDQNNTNIETKSPTQDQEWDKLTSEEIDALHSML